MAAVSSVLVNHLLATTITDSEGLPPWWFFLYLGAFIVAVIIGCIADGRRSGRK